MAKATAICTCKECGTTFQKEKKCTNRRDAISWEKWAEAHFDLCPKCYAAQIQKEEESRGLYVDVLLETREAFFGGNRIIAIVFGGNTKPIKDEIKALGARYTSDYPSPNAIGNLFGLERNYNKWVLWAGMDDWEEKLKMAQGLGAEINSMPSNASLALYTHIKDEVDRKKKAKEDAIKKELEETIGSIIPQWPTEIKDMWPDGAHWNGKFYGKNNNWTVYFSGEKVKLTDAQKAEMEDAYKRRQEWRKKKEEIERKYSSLE